MARFVDINREFINTDHIRSYNFTKGGQLNITFSDGEQKAFDVRSSEYLRGELKGANHIVQIILCPEPLWIVLECEDGEHFAERVLLFGLCADGGVHPISSSFGYFDIEDGAFSLCTEEELSQIKNLKHLKFLNREVVA